MKLTQISFINEEQESENVKTVSLTFALVEGAERDASYLYAPVRQIISNSSRS
jgi:hypothetical protein